MENEQDEDTSVRLESGYESMRRSGSSAETFSVAPWDRALCSYQRLRHRHLIESSFQALLEPRHDTDLAAECWYWKSIALASVKDSHSSGEQSVLVEPG